MSKTAVRALWTALEHSFEINSAIGTIERLSALIRDVTIVASIQQQWHTVTQLCAESHQQSQIPGGPFIKETSPESFYNLPFLLAYAVLDEVLDVLIEQGTVQRPKGIPMLGNKMKSSLSTIRWEDYSLVESGNTERNQLAHHATLLDKASCLAFVDAIEIELRSWGVL